MMKSIRSLIQILLLSSFIFTGLISCSTTNTVRESTEDLVLEEEIKAPLVPTVAKQYTNINIVPAPKPDISEEEKEANFKKAEEIKEFTMNMTEEQRKFYYIKRTSDYEVIGEDLDYKIMVNHDSKEVIIQFEESDSNEDWRNNCLVFPWPLKLDNKVVWTTYGYAKIYKSAENIPIDQFMEQIEKYPDYKVVIWGWSLGSAMAKIIARHLIIRSGGKIQIDELTTYGDVKCWYNPFFSLKKNVVRIREYVTWNDTITGCIPICRRDKTCRVGEKWSARKSKDVEYYHTHYYEYDYSMWE